MNRPDVGIDGDRYVTWDAAYVLGSLSSAERREFEAHLETCDRCRAAVAEISGMPALLAMLDVDDVQALDDGAGTAAAASRGAASGARQGALAAPPVAVADDRRPSGWPPRCWRSGW